MIIEYDIACFERTLTIQFPDRYEHLKETILASLDKYYDAWHNADDTPGCLEEYMVNEVCNEYDLTYNEWESIPYGEDYEPRENMWVCDHCLCAIESREGNQARLAHFVDEYDAVESKCDWCEEVGFDTLYELV